MQAILRHAAKCIAAGEKLRDIFDSPPPSTEKVAAHAFFCRCIDHLKAVVLLAQNDLDVEALALVRGIAETTFVIGALLTGTVSYRGLAAFDLAGRAKSAKAQKDFLFRNATKELQEKVQAFGDAHAGPTLKFEQLAKGIDSEDLYNGHYRMFSHAAAHPTMTSVEKYLDYGIDQTCVKYPGTVRPQKEAVLHACSLFLLTCASIEHWMGTTTPEINQSISDLQVELESFGSVTQPE